MNIYCDNYATCHGVVFDWSNDLPTDDMLRVRGWRRWRGESLTGAHLDVTLCSTCVASKRLVRAEVLEGQEELF